jgi:hypothetical protein
MLMGNASKILQTVSGNIDRDIFQEALASLEELILLTDTTGVLTGMEKFVVKGVQVAIQRETQRQRQLELLQQTNNPTDIHIMGIKGRGALLRSVSGQVGLAGEEIVPPDEVLEKMQKKQEEDSQDKKIADAVKEGVISGTKQAVTRITSELESGILAQQYMMPEGAPTHIGTPGVLPPGGGAGQPPGAGGGSGPPGAGGGGPPQPGPPGSPANPHAQMSRDDGPQTALIGKPAPASPNETVSGGPH